jgi:cation transport regulator ChaC
VKTNREQMKRWYHWMTTSSLLSWCHYRLQGISLLGGTRDLVWYFAYGANMHDSAFRERRRMQPREWRVGRLPGYRLRFNLDGRPKGKAAPANLTSDAEAEVWGALYCITGQDLLLLDASEGVPGRRYRHLWVAVQDADGNVIQAVTYIANGNEIDGNPSLRYITLLREGARAHALPQHYLQFLDDVIHASP